MSGDVFGNGMLLSKHTKLIGAFNHLHIFIDPDPDAARSWAERERLFRLPRSTWKDYDPAVLSAGGDIFERRAKSITLSPQAAARLGVANPTLSPNELILVLLKLPVDLLWFGGIGTYVKATAENNAQAGDRANDPVRVNATELRAKVVGEGANLAVTQGARIEYALRGGRINTDAIDNSAGVDTSDHEVNIKIGVGDAIAAGLIAKADRASFLASMTDEVEHLVLRDNYLQTLALTLAESDAATLLDSHAALMRAMEKHGKLDRAVEFLPDDETLAQRAAAQRGLTRPEIAVILAYAKNGLYDALLRSSLPDAPEMQAELLQYFPARLRDLAPEVLKRHRLRREIVATVIANALVNRMGPSFVEDTQRRTGRESEAIARAFLIVRDIFDLPAVWAQIEGLDNQVPAAVQTRLLHAVSVFIEQAVRWFLLSGLALDHGARVAQFKPGVGELGGMLTRILPPAEVQVNANRQQALVDAGAPAAIAERIVTLNTLSTAMDIAQISADLGRDVADVGTIYFAVGTEFGLLAMRRQARLLPATNEWQKLAADAVMDDSYVQQREIVRFIAGGKAGADPKAVSDWINRRSGPGSAVREVVSEIARTSPPNLALLTVAGRRVRAAVG
jgi:glutamate dehydrogenase